MPGVSMEADPFYGSEMRRKAASLWPLLLPILILLPGLGAFPYPPGQGSFSDLAITHYPNAEFLRRAILEYHTIPLWSPSILSGAPFAADLLSGLWYPPGWLALWLPLPLGFNLCILLHILLGGVGMYALLRSEGLGHAAALLGGMAFESMPKLFAHYGAGHLTLLYALPWTPWLLWAARRRLGADEKSIPNLEGLFLALIILADVRWAFYAGVLWLGYALAAPLASSETGRLRLIGRRLLHLAGQGGLAAGLGALLILPLLEFVGQSTRQFMTAQDVFAYSLPPARLLGLLFPDLGGFHEFMLYPGAVALLLVCLLLVGLAARRGWRFWLVMALLTLVFSMGEYIPGLSSLARLPGFSLLRVPARALFLSGMGFCILAAYAVDGLGSELPQQFRRRASLLLTALAAFGLILPLAIWIASGQLSQDFTWGGVWTLLGAVWLGIRLRGRLSGRAWLAGLAALCLLDWGGVNWSLFTSRPAADALSEGREAAALLQSAPSSGRVYSPSYSLPQQTAAHYQLELADGVNPMQLWSYRDFMQAASGVPCQGYGVTVPPFASGDPKTANQGYTPDAFLLGLLNVRYVAAEYDLRASGLVFWRQVGETRLYENQVVLPRAWVQPVNTEIGLSAMRVESLHWAPNRIEVAAAGPGLLVLSEIFYPGWQALLDGRRTDIQAVKGILRGVVLPEGDHQVVFAFHPGSVYVGALLTLAALVYWLVRFTQRRASKEEGQ
ncbi:MAG: YfhO family protein [Anaerolineales bacterium]|nr:YfhO family protein [Anaerolineales bacterium]